MAKKYRIKLKNDRVVGPFGLRQFEELFQKGHITGSENVQTFPSGDWKPLKSFGEIVELIAVNEKSNSDNPADLDWDSTVARISLAKLKEKERKNKKELEKKEQLEKIEKLDFENKVNEHQEFKFKREEPQTLVDYEELEKQYTKEEPAQAGKDVEEPEESNKNIEKTRVLKRPKSHDEDFDKTQVNPEALKWFQEEEVKKAAEERQKLEEELNIEEEIQEESVDFDESTQFIDRGALVKLKVEARELERDIQSEEDRLSKLDHVEDIPELVEEDEGEEVAPKKTRPLMLFIIVAFIVYLLFDDDKVEKKFEPKFIKITSPHTYEVVNREEADKNFRLGIQKYRMGNYLSKVEASQFFMKSIEYKFKDNPALGFLILTFGELFENVSNKSKGAAILFNLIKITNSKVLSDLNIAMGTVLFYKNNNKKDSAIYLIEKFLRVGKPSLKLLSIYLDLAIETGDLVKAKKIVDKIKDFPDRPLEAFLALSRFHTLDERYDQGKEVVLEGLNRFPSSVPLLLDLSDYLLREENFKAYAAVLKQVEALKFEGSPQYYARYLEYVGILSAYNQDVKTAAKLFKIALKINNSDRLRSKLASLDLGGGKVAERLILESKAIDLIRKSKKLMKAKRWEDAFKAAIEVVDLDLNYLPADLHLAELQIKRGYYEAAIESLEFLKKEYPVHPAINFLYIEALYEANKINDAQLQVNIISNSPLRQHKLYHSVLGHYYERAGRTLLAVKFLNQSVAVNPLRDQDYYLMAKIYSRSRQYKESKIKLAEAITLDPLNIEYKSLYAHILFDLEGADTAIGYLKTSLDENVDNPKLMGDMAIFYYRNGQIAQFQEMKEKIENLNSDDPSFYKFIIEAAQIEEKTPRVIEAAQSLIEVNPGDVKTRMLLGQSLAKVGRYQDALEALEGVTTRLSTYPRVFYLMAKVYIQIKDYKKALEAAEKEVENNKDIYNGHYILGETYRLLGKYNKSIKSLERAISIDPRNVESLMALGWIKLNQRYYDIARELYLRAKKQQSSNPEIRKQLGFIYQGIGQSGLAIEEFGTYLKLYPNAPDRAQVEGQIRALSR